MVVVTEVDPFDWRAWRGRALTWAEKRRKKERKTKNLDWDGMVNVRRIVDKIPVLPNERPSVQGEFKDWKGPRAKEKRKMKDETKDGSVASQYPFRPRT